MEARTCPRCGREFVQSRGRGRPKRWCSGECRRLASEERRAARRGGRPIEIREHVRERTIERARPLSPDGAVDRVLSSDLATQRLLRVLAHRMRTDPPVSDHERWMHSTYKPYISDLAQAHGETETHTAAALAPQTTPAAFVPPQNRAEAHRQAVALVLNSPRSTREVLHALAERARAGELANGEHSGTVAAAEELLDALIVSRTLRIPRR